MYNLISLDHDIEEHRNWWAEIAKQNGWYKQPFYIQVWIDQYGEIEDSVSHKDMKRDYIIDNF